MDRTAFVAFGGAGGGEVDRTAFVAFGGAGGGEAVLATFVAFGGGGCGGSALAFLVFCRTLSAALLILFRAWLVLLGALACRRWLSSAGGGGLL